MRFRVDGAIQHEGTEIENQKNISTECSAAYRACDWLIQNLRFTWCFYTCCSIKTKPSTLSFFLNVFKQHICSLSLVSFKTTDQLLMICFEGIFSWFVFKLFWHSILLLWLEECFWALSSSDCLWMCVVCEKKRTFLALSWKVTMILPVCLSHSVLWWFCWLSGNDKCC